MVTEAQSSMQDLLVIGDIFGFPGVGDLSNFDGRPHRLLRLADISGRPDLSGEGLHEHLFKGGGLEHAVHKLCKIDASACIGLGFSAGGTLLWNAVKLGLRLQALICVSSTRLRLETAPLAIPTMTLWGELDPHRPAGSWNAAVPGLSKIYADQPHDFYRGQLGNPCSSLRKDISAFLAESLTSS
jgi:hypothetical protein